MQDNRHESTSENGNTKTNFMFYTPCDNHHRRIEILCQAKTDHIGIAGDWRNAGLSRENIPDSVVESFIPVAQYMEAHIGKFISDPQIYGLLLYNFQLDLIVIDKDGNQYFNLYFIETPLTNIHDIQTKTDFDEITGKTEQFLFAIGDNGILINQKNIDFDVLDLQENDKGEFQYTLPDLELTAIHKGVCQLNIHLTRGYIS